MEKDSSDCSNAENGKDRSQSAKELKCSVCSKIFLHASLSRHMASKCGMIKMFPCDGCAKVFGRRDSLQIHKGTCKGKDRVWKCDKEFLFNAYHRRKFLPSNGVTNMILCRCKDS